MIKNTLIIALVIVIIYLYYQKNTKTNVDSNFSELRKEFLEVVKINKTFARFCQQEIGGQDINEIRTKLNGRKLSELLEKLEDYETDVDTLTRKKNELEQDLLAQSNSYKSLVKEKEGIIKRLEKDKKDLQEFSKEELEKLKNTTSSSEPEQTDGEEAAHYYFASTSRRGRGGRKISSTRNSSASSSSEKNSSENE